MTLFCLIAWRGIHTHTHKNPIENLKIWTQVVWSTDKYLGVCRSALWSSVLFVCCCCCLFVCCFFCFLSSSHAWHFDDHHKSWGRKKWVMCRLPSMVICGWMSECFTSYRTTVAFTEKNGNTSKCFVSLLFRQCSRKTFWKS